MLHEVSILWTLSEITLIFPQMPLSCLFVILVTIGVASSVKPFLNHKERNSYSVFSSFTISHTGFGHSTQGVQTNICRPQRKQMQGYVLSCPPLQVVGARFSRIFWGHLWNTFQSCPPGVQRREAFIHGFCPPLFTGDPTGINSATFHAARMWVLADVLLLDIKRSTGEEARVM